MGSNKRWSANWDLSTIPEELVLSEAGRRNNAKRTTRAGGVIWGMHRPDYPRYRCAKCMKNPKGARRRDWAIRHGLTPAVAMCRISDMRKLLGGLLLLGAVTASIGFCAPVLAPPSPLCSSFGTGPANDISIPFATWTAVNFNGEQADKIFSNFAIAGLPTNTTLELQTQSVGGLDLHAATRRKP
jgi:hypothetical protein